MMRFLQEEDPVMFKVYHGVAQSALDFFWAANNNNLTPGSISGQLKETWRQLSTPGNAFRNS